jgi:hypothetical protein
LIREISITMNIRNHSMLVFLMKIIIKYIFFIAINLQIRWNILKEIILRNWLKITEFKKFMAYINFCFEVWLHFQY